MKEDTSYRFDFPKSHFSRSPIIKVMGAGGGGSNAVNRMYSRGIKDVTFVVCNTDAQALENSIVPNKLQLGLNLTSGLGAGANPEVGRNAALESKDDIKNLLEEDTRMLFITAGMGGGTGTGAAPVIASIAKKLGILTVGIVTMPFSFEGKKKLGRAEEGVRQLKEHCDTVLPILNDRLKEVYGNLTIDTAFAQADEVLMRAVEAISGLVTKHKKVNVDFEDIKTVLKDAGPAVIGYAIAEGEYRAIRAAQQALFSPLLDCKDIRGATKILLSIESGPDAELQMDELTEITDYIQEQVGVDAELIFGHGTDSQLGESICVTVIATGFQEEGLKQANTAGEQAEQTPIQTSFLGPESLSSRGSSISRPAILDRSLAKTPEPIATTETAYPKNPAEKKVYFRDRAVRLAQKIKAGKQALFTEQEIKERSELPAYVRKNITLEHLALPTKNVVRHALEEEEATL